MAAVIATESPSQPSPLVSHRTWTTWRSAMRLPGCELDRRASARPRSADGGDELLDAADVGLDHRGELLLEAAVQVPLVAVPGDQAGLGEPRQRVRDRRPLGADEPAEQLMGERQRQPDAAGLDLAPARGEVPQQQRQANLEARLGGDRALDVEVARAPARRAAAAPA